LHECRIKAVNWSSLVIIAFILRCILVFSFPQLSDDIYRFVWDGLLISEGIHPLSYTPEQVMNLYPDLAWSGLYEKLNSQQYYTVYPPLSQLVFYISAIPGVDQMAASGIIIKLFLLASEWGIYLVARRILQMHGLAKWYVLIYILNPLVMLEIMGNAHFESFCILSFLVAVYFLGHKRQIYSAAALASSVAFKMFPLMFAPLLWRYWKDKKLLFGYILGTSLFGLLFFAPFFLGLDVMHFLSSLDLYFQKFEFNASVYFLLRQLGIWLTGYNQIQVIGPFLAMIVILFIAFQSWRNTPKTSLEFLHLSTLVFSFYLVLATTVHPWYLCFLVGLTVFRPRLYVIVWSYSSVFSYVLYSATMGGSYYIWVCLEYIIVACVYLWERKLLIAGNKKTLAE